MCHYFVVLEEAVASFLPICEHYLKSTFVVSLGTAWLKAVKQSYGFHENQCFLEEKS
jgi:hypothetical protein